jgi:hypothetical protein
MKHSPSQGPLVRWHSARPQLQRPWRPLQPVPRRAAALMRLPRVAQAAGAMESHTSIGEAVRIACEALGRQPGQAEEQLVSAPPPPLLCWRHCSGATGRLGGTRRRRGRLVITLAAPQIARLRDNWYDTHTSAFCWNC